MTRAALLVCGLSVASAFQLVAPPAGLRHAVASRGVASIRMEDDVTDWGMDNLMDMMDDAVEDEFGVLKTQFEAVDVNGDGFISQSELESAIKSCYPDELPSALKDIEALVKAADTNGDGKIDYKEYVKLAASLA